jgi:NAD(P)-dependent dehydrogenase (short-subunit alcohol dehydrogenase family)
MARIIHKVSKEDLNKDLSGKNYIVTGSNSGIGFATTEQLVKQGAHVIMAVRNIDNGKKKSNELRKLKGTTEVIYCDLENQESIRSLVNQIEGEELKIDGLVCNAGFVNAKRTREITIDGFERTIAASYFGHYLLTELLLENLQQSEDSRIVLVSSVMHANTNGNIPHLDFEDLNYENKPYNDFLAYGDAKLAVVMYGLELGNRLQDKNVSVFSVHPGWARSNFGKTDAGMIMKTLMKGFGPIATLMGMSDSNEDSAQTTLHCLLSDDVNQHSGKYFSQSSVIYKDKTDKNGGWPMQSPNPQANDLDESKKLVQKTRELIKI